MGVETRGRTQHGNGDRSGAENESSSRDGKGCEDWDSIGKSGGGAKKRDKPYKSRRRNVGNGRDLNEEIKKRRQERVGSVAVESDNLENTKKAGREAQCTQGLSMDRTSRESVSPLSRLIRTLRNKYN